MANQIDTVAARELSLHADNTQPMVAIRQLVEIALTKKLIKGRYDSAKAPQAFAYMIEDAAKDYAKEYGGVWHEMYNAPTRRALCVEYAAWYEKSVRTGCFGDFTGEAEQMLERATDLDALIAKCFGEVK